MGEHSCFTQSWGDANAKGCTGLGLHVRLKLADHPMFVR